MKRSFIALALVLGMASVVAVYAQGAGNVTIGIVPSLLADLSEGQQKFIGEEFPLLVKEFTGLSGVLERPTTTKELAAKVLAGTEQFGVFQGIEFAEWQAKHPELQPLLLSVYRLPQVKAVLVAKKDAGVESFASLKGKEVAVLKEGKEHIRRYVQKEAGGDPAKYFSKVVTPVNSEAALDAVLLDKVEAAVVDLASLDIYREVNPGRFRRLKVIGESPLFPPSVIAYNPSKVDAALAKQFKDGMLRANQSAKGREVMGTFKITSFEAVPAGFEKSLAEILKVYAE